MTLLRSIIICILVLATASSYAQSRKKGKKKAKARTDQPTSLEPYLPQKTYEPKASSKKKTQGPTYESEEKYYQRMEELQKTKRKNERESLDPQYSDPSYFGHKRPPKKRKPGKMKFCKECGLRH